MVIEVPDDLERCADEQLRELDTRLDDARLSVRMAMRRLPAVDPMSARPEWARKLSAVLETRNGGKFDRYSLIIAVLFGLLLVVPSLIRGVYDIRARYDQSRQAP